MNINQEAEEESRTLALYTGSGKSIGVRERFTTLAGLFCSLLMAAWYKASRSFRGTVSTSPSGSSTETPSLPAAETQTHWLVVDFVFVAIVMLNFQWTVWRFNAGVVVEGRVSNWAEPHQKQNLSWFMVRFISMRSCEGAGIWTLDLLIRRPAS